ncbi:MAG: hypothetical protein QNK37_29530 [Acidobacteriota bacterium]|nr:hypothetical protein [Acidobacteriota bacterium]
MKQFLIPQTLAGTGVQFAFGLVLIVVGVLVWPLGTTQPEPQPKPSPAETAPTDQTSDAVQPVADQTTSWRLMYRREQGHWMITPKGGRAEVLTDIIPGPGENQERTPFLSLAQVRTHLLDVLTSSQFNLTGGEIENLLKLRLDNEPLFRPDDFKAGRVVSPTSRVSAPEKPKPATTSSGAPPAVADFDPLHPDFSEQMLAWKKQVQPHLDAVKGETGTVSFNMNDLRVPMSKRARRRAAANDFGSKPVDAAIFIQYKTIEAGESIEVDGGLGSGSKKALAAVLQNMPNAARYIDLLADTTVSGIPRQLQPGTALFNSEMKTWAGRIRSALSGIEGAALIRFKPDFHREELELSLSADIARRLKNPGFGSQKRDEQIYLQYLANRYGETVDIDGEAGPETRKALARVLTGPFRHTNLGASYQRLIKNRYR